MTLSILCFGVSTGRSALCQHHFYFHWHIYESVHRRIVSLLPFQNSPYEIVPAVTSEGYDHHHRECSERRSEKSPCTDRSTICSESRSLLISTHCSVCSALTGKPAFSPITCFSSSLELSAPGFSVAPFSPLSAAGAASVEDSPSPFPPPC